jgi:hypothetical protein
VGALLVAFAARGNLLFHMAHQTAVLRLTQTLAFLQVDAIQTNITNINKKGQVFSVIYDYIYRNRSCENMTFWTYIETHKMVAKKTSTHLQTDIDETLADGMQSIYLVY